MKIKTLLLIILFILLMIIIAISILHFSDESQKRNKNITIQQIDNHEYLVTGYKGGITHKVNCKFCKKEE